MLQWYSPSELGLRFDRCHLHLRLDLCHHSSHDLLEHPNATKEEGYGMDFAELGSTGIDCYTLSTPFHAVLERKS